MEGRVYVYVYKVTELLIFLLCMEGRVYVYVYKVTELLTFLLAWKDVRYHSTTAIILASGLGWSGILDHAK